MSTDLSGMARIAAMQSPRTIWSSGSTRVSTGAATLRTVARATFGCLTFSITAITSPLDLYSRQMVDSRQGLSG